MGGIYSLGEIANEGPELRRTVAEVLTAYVRMHAPRSIHGAKGSEAITSGEIEPRFDVQAALNVIGRIGVPGIDLRETNLTGADLRGSLMRSAHLSHAIMRSVKLDGAQLHEADLSNAVLYDAVLGSAELEGAKLQHADLPRDLRGAHLDRAILYGASLKDRFLERAHLSGADLSGETHLEGANFSGAVLPEADFQSSFLDNATLVGADLRGAKFQSSILQNANFRGATLDGADFASADLNRCQMPEVNLREVRGLKWAQISQAFINRYTQLPPDVESAMPPQVRAVLERQTGNDVGIGCRPADIGQSKQGEQPNEQAEV